MEISSKLNLKIIKKINSEGVNSALYIVEDEQLNCEMILKQIDKKKLKEYDKYFEESKKISALNHPNIIKVNNIFDGILNMPSKRPFHALLFRE